MFSHFIDFHSKHLSDWSSPLPSSYGFIEGVGYSLVVITLTACKRCSKYLSKNVLTFLKSLLLGFLFIYCIYINNIKLYYKVWILIDFLWFFEICLIFKVFYYYFCAYLFIYYLLLKYLQKRKI